MVLAALHGDASWDELLIAGVALVVLWVAIKIAGRKAPDEEEDGNELAEEPASAGTPSTMVEDVDVDKTTSGQPAEVAGDPVHPPVSKLG